MFNYTYQFHIMVSDYRYLSRLLASSAKLYDSFRKKVTSTKTAAHLFNSSFMETASYARFKDMGEEGMNSSNAHRELPLLHAVLYFSSLIHFYLSECPSPQVSITQASKKTPIPLC